MNFLIISLARCGSTSLQKSISNHYNLKIVFEPYAAWGLQRRKYSFENVVVKTILHQIDNKEFRLGNLPESHFEKCFNFYLNLSNKFDKVILLSRENTKEHAESLFNLYNGNPFDVKYVYNQTEDITPIVNQLILENKYLKKLSESLGLPIDTYESIYYGNGLSDKSIQLDFSVLDTKNKLRQINVPKTLL
ncbi:hypothetical protein EB155_05500 [archaeon]|jgi:hypothetical protein|nr:hypothetical protein [archaeon]NDB55456.1 hypothetical protein [archaeon]NDB79304.1 hypothetical protein [archaeon]